MQFANRSQFIFDVKPEEFAANAIANNVYATPEDMREKLGDLARLVYTRAELAVLVELASAGTGVVVVRLTDGATNYATATLNFTAGKRKTVKLTDIDLSAVKGGTKLYIAVDVTTATGAATGSAFAKLNIEHPVVIG